MADISKKIFSIDPEPDEDRVVEFPPMPIDLSEKAEADNADAQSDGSPDDEDTALKGDTRRKPIHLHPVDELTDSEIVQSIKSVSPVPNAAKPEAPKVEALVLSDEDAVAHDDEPVRRPIALTNPQPVPSQRLVAAVAPRPVESRIDTIQPSSPSFGWVGVILTLLTALCIGGIVYVMLSRDGALSPIEIAALTGITIIPAATVAILWSALRALARLSSQAQYLQATAERLTRADDTVADRVTSLSASIRSELAGVDAHLARTETQLASVADQAISRGADLAQMTQDASESARTLDHAITGQREQFRVLLSEFEIRLQSLAQSIDRHAGLLDTAGRETSDRIEASTQSMSDALSHVTQQGDALTSHVETADEKLAAAEARLSALSDTIAERTVQLDGVYDRRADHLSGLSDRISKDADETSHALSQQADQLAAIDAQIISTEQSLKALLSEAQTIQHDLSSRLSDIDGTLSNADRRSRAFTADMSDRINDSIAQTRRELSVMEGELRSLQSRMDEQRELDLSRAEQRSRDEERAQPKRIHLQPLDTDFPPVEPQSLDIPDEADDSLLDLVEIVEIPDPDRNMHSADVVLRSVAEETDRRGFALSRRKTADDGASTGWRWRDMLGTIDPLDQTYSDVKASEPPPSRSQIDRPPPGVPLQAPQVTSDIARAADGSDVVARLCEVNLAPSAIVDEGTIYEAAALRQTSGIGAQNAAVEARLEGPIDHLRKVFQEDLEFKLRAESFRRDYEERLSTLRGDDALQAKLGSATGRAYLLCTAALHPA